MCGVVTLSILRHKRAYLVRRDWTLLQPCYNRIETTRFCRDTLHLLPFAVPFCSSCLRLVSAPFAISRLPSFVGAHCLPQRGHAGAVVPCVSLVALELINVRRIPLAKLRACVDEVIYNICIGRTSCAESASPGVASARHYEQLRGTGRGQTLL